MICMDIKIHYTFLPHSDPEESLSFYRDRLGFEVTKDVGQGTMRWITIAHPSNPDVSIVLEPPLPDPNVPDEERRVVQELMAKGLYGRLTLATSDLDGLFEKLAADGAEVVQEPTDQFYGVRDGAVRDPAGNLIRINQL